MHHKCPYREGWWIVHCREKQRKTGPEREDALLLVPKMEEEAKDKGMQGVPLSLLGKEGDHCAPRTCRGSAALLIPCFWSL